MVVASSTADAPPGITVPLSPRAAVPLLLLLLVLLSTAAAGAATGRGEEPSTAPDGHVIKGSWRVAHGPSEFYTSHFYEIHYYAPPSSTTFQFVADDPAEADLVQWGSELDRDRAIVPDSCFEIDPATAEPMSEEAGRDRYGGFEKVKHLILGRSPIYAREELVTFRFNRLNEKTAPLLIPKGSPMRIRCGPLLHRHTSASGSALPHRVAFTDGRAPDGFRSAMFNGNFVSDPFIEFTILPTTPSTTLIVYDGDIERDGGKSRKGKARPTAALRSMNQRAGKAPLVDATETKLRTEGFHFEVSLGYDAWDIDRSDPRQMLDLKRRIARGFTCSPLPCHRRLRSRHRSFLSVESMRSELGLPSLGDDTDALRRPDAQLIAAVGNASFAYRPRHDDGDLDDEPSPSAASTTACSANNGGTSADCSGGGGDDGTVGAASNDETDSIIRAADVTLSDVSAFVDIDPDTLIERGFDLIPARDPPLSDVDHTGRSIDDRVPETYYTLEFVLPPNSSTRYAEIASRVSHQTARLALTVTLQAYKWSPPVLRLLEYAPAEDHYEALEVGRALTITEDCLTGRNTTSRCDHQLVMAINGVRPSNAVVDYARDLDDLLSYALQPLSASDGNDDDDFARCRQRENGLRVRESFHMREYAQSDAPHVVYIGVHKTPEGRTGPSLDIDRPVRFTVDHHPDVFLSKQPTHVPVERGAFEVAVVPSPATCAVSFACGGKPRLDVVVPVVDGTRSLELDVALTVDCAGDVFRPEAVLDMSHVAFAVLQSGLGFALPSGDIRALASMDVTLTHIRVIDLADAKRSCGGVSSFAVESLTFDGKWTSLTTAGAELTVVADPSAQAPLVEMLASELMPTFQADGGSCQVNIAAERSDASSAEGDL